MKNLLLTFAALITASTAMAGNEAQNKLITALERPTPAEIMSNQENFAGITIRASDTIPVLYAQDIPIVIVSLEKAFPGGTYAFLGRDMDLVADAVEAFYLSIGQKDRVKRIRISTPSMQGATPELMTEFLIQSGLNADPNVHKPPIVIVDYTTFRPSSQSTNILKLALTGLEKKGLPAYGTMARLNIATIHNAPAVPTHNIIDLPIESIEKTLEAQNFLWATKHEIKEVLRIPVGGIAYGSEWHGSYGPIYRNHDGLLVTKPSGYFTSTKKELVFNTIAMALMISTSDDFKKSVTELAIKNSVHITGLDTPVVERPVARKAIEPVNQEISADSIAAEFRLARALEQFRRNTNFIRPEFDTLDFGFPWKNKETIPLSRNGYTLMSILSVHLTAEPSHVHRVVLEKLLLLLQDQRIRDLDVERIFSVLLKEIKITDPHFVKYFQDNYTKAMSLEALIGKSETRNRYMQLPWIAGDNYRLLTNQGALPLSCKFLLLN